MGALTYRYRCRETGIIDDGGIGKRKFTRDISPDEIPVVKLVFDNHFGRKGQRLSLTLSPNRANVLGAVLLCTKQLFENGFVIKMHL